MSLVGYRNLEALKARLLPADMAGDSAWDADITVIGLGVAAMFDRVTGRELRRNAAAKFECPADVSSVVLKSYPVESLYSVSLHSGNGSSSLITAAVLGLHKASGIVDFGEVIGLVHERLEIVSTGGYWCDAGAGSVMPTAATPLPDDLLQAWYAQCRATADAEGLFRQKGAGNFSDKDKREPSLRMDSLDLIPSVRRTLQLYLRMP
jgi:hypothetical protein